MISKLSNRITRNLLKQDVISDEEKELYDYGIFMMISYIVFFVITLLFGLVFKIPLLSVIFYVVFCLIRNFAGGIHANSEIQCDIFTTMLLFVSVIAIKVLIEYELIWIAIVVLITSSISLCVTKPVASPQKEISKQEETVYHKKVFVLIVIFVIVSLLSIIFNKYSIVFAIAIGLTLSNTLLIMGKIQKKGSASTNNN